MKQLPSFCDRVTIRTQLGAAKWPVTLYVLMLTLIANLPAAAQSLYDRPVRAIELGMHTAPIWAVAVDAAGRFAVTGSEDKTVRVWSVADGKLLRTIRVPVGPERHGKIFSVAMAPNGDLVAAGGTTDEPDMPIYLFDRWTGEMTSRIAGLQNSADGLAFSADGRFLAAMLRAGGLRVYGRDQNWSEVFRDISYGSRGNSAAFADDGRLATTDYAGRVRLYDRSFKLIGVKATTTGRYPRTTAFSPNGKLLAVGYADVAAVDLFDAQTLEAIPGPVADGLGSLPAVAWSADGKTLFAGGVNEADTDGTVFAWDERDPALPTAHATLATGRLARPYPGRTFTGWTAPALAGAFGNPG